jgi:hypothetical protein
VTSTLIVSEPTLVSVPRSASSARAFGAIAQNIASHAARTRRHGESASSSSGNKRCAPNTQANVLPTPASLRMSSHAGSMPECCRTCLTIDNRGRCRRFRANGS